MDALIATMRIIWFLGLCWTLANASSEENLKDLDFRAKRQINALPLIYPYGATYKLIIGYTAPIKNDDKIGLNFLFNFQYQYVQFTNITQLSQYYVINSVSREQRDAEVAARKNERIVFYRAVAEMMDAGGCSDICDHLDCSDISDGDCTVKIYCFRKGLNGRECVLRAICEAAQFPVEDEGFVGEILHVLLTPDYGQYPFGDQDEDLKEDLMPYVDAAVAGRQMFSCSYIYHDCPEGQGILEFISQLRDE